jgi:hypothetical protein
MDAEGVLYRRQHVPKREYRMERGQVVGSTLKEGSLILGLPVSSFNGIIHFKKVITKRAWRT